MQQIKIFSVCVLLAYAVTAQQHPRFKYIEAPTRYQNEERFLPITTYIESDETDDNLNPEETGSQYRGGADNGFNAGFGGAGFGRGQRGQAYRGGGGGGRGGANFRQGARNVRGGGEGFGGGVAGFGGGGGGFPRGAFNYGLDSGRDFGGSHFGGTGFGGGGHRGGGVGRGAFGRGAYLKK